jgi:hypothetical protein
LFFNLRQSLTKLSSLVLNLRSSYSSSGVAGSTIRHHHAHHLSEFLVVLEILRDADQLVVSRLKKFFL